MAWVLPRRVRPDGLRPDGLRLEGLRPHNWQDLICRADQLLLLVVHHPVIHNVATELHSPSPTPGMLP